MTRIDELLAEIKRVRAEMQSRGLLSDPGRLDSRLLKMTDELAFIVKGQFKEINKLKRKLRKVTKLAEEQSKAMRTPAEKPKPPDEATQTHNKEATHEQP